MFTEYVFAIYSLHVISQAVIKHVGSVLVILFSVVIPKVIMTVTKGIRVNIYPVSIYLFRVNNGRTKTIYEIYSKFTIKTPKRRNLC